MNRFNSFEELDLELKQVYLKKEIAKERIKGLGLEVQHELNSISWLKKGLNGIIKYGALLFVRKLIKR
ncbi:hypothetical protein [Allomuricauda sp. d1]|uniref:hypothetical protein n=1 Tax=Allomuricauda sp. d1 TaxID=3136725 RepID=UPI0031D9ABFF